MRKHYLIFTWLLAIFSLSTLAANSKTVDYFTDNGFSNAVGPPAGVYHKGVTYVAYQGPQEDAWVASYDHQKARWNGPYLAGVSALGKDPSKGKIDNHGKPSLIIDDKDHIHIVYGGHGGTPQLGENTLGNYNGGEQRHVVSEHPLDITTWKRLNNISPFGTYSEWIKMDNGHLYLFYRHGAHRSNWVYQVSNDHGQSFAPPVSIALTKHRTDMPAQDSWYISFRKIPGDKIAARVYYHLCKDAPHHDGERQNAYYMEMNINDHIWRNIKGEALDTPFTKEYIDKHALVANTGSKWVHSGPLTHDPKGFPHFLMYMGDNVKNERHGGPKEVYHYRWDGTNWLHHGPHKKMGNQRGQIRAFSPSNIEILLAEKAKLVKWDSHNGGKGFDREGVHFDGEKGSLLTSGFIKNAHPDARLLVASKVLGTDYRRVYLIGDKGPVKRNRAEANILSTQQKAEPLVKPIKK